ncbi:MAG: P-type conjugative transfer protein TrbL [Synergistales bacterium]|nr:P-type conjugative transfer protein TrbL [Synergistales bacterium]MDY6401701.1 P-type conjugative transfer protein TrbL [Synergistales bacterium]MDY6404509.1 P-type conjugative transfer protein TrbL [Synergistales bacterium]MDY6410581.1 P-type conjugative transfer protein TrbL [Synergistales bacterium]MDY6413666.1 P-type conjugative transfer protein TrbL [Synergistales bacterium]
MSKKIFCIILFTLLFISITQAFADDSGLNTTVQEATKLMNFSSETAENFLAIARNLFVGLATISLAMGLIRMLLMGESNIGSLMSHIAKWIIYVGVFTWMLANLNTVSFIPKIIVNSFVAIGGKMGPNPADISPDNLLASGIRIYGIIVERGWNAGWGDFVGLTFIGIVILVVIAITAGFIAVAIVEMHLVISGGAILLGFGGFEYTRDIALSYIRYSISVGMKLLMILFVYSIAIKVIPNWENEFKSATDMTALITQSGQILGGTICVLMIVIIIPSIAQKIVTGASMTFGHNEPVIGYTPYNPVYDVSRHPYEPVRSVTDANRPYGSYAAGQAQSNQAAYTARADELMFGGSNLNPTNLRPDQREAALRASSGGATFSNYVPPDTGGAPRTATTRDIVQPRFDYGASVSAPGRAAADSESVSRG